LRRSDALKVFADLSYVRAEDVAQIPVFASKPKYVIYGPLAEIPSEPDVVLSLTDSLKLRQPPVAICLADALLEVSSGAIRRLILASG
jgi:anthranilate/para-aminobenzoate synthase component II